MTAILVGLTFLAVILALVLTVKSLIVIVPPNMAAVITGRTRVVDNGGGEAVKIGYRTVVGGRTLRIPILERVQWLSLETIPLEVTVENAYSKGNIPLNVHAIANVKVASAPENVFSNAVERLLGKQMNEIRTLAQETLTGNLRGVLATLTPEEVNEDRLKFANELIEEADLDLQKLGLHLDVLKVQNVSDEQGYLEAIGRQKTAEVQRVARVAEAENKKMAEVAEAENKKASKVAVAQADIEIAEAENRLRVRKAELDQEGRTKENIATVGAEKARVQAEQELESERVETERRRQQANVVVPAQAALEAAQARAKAEAAPIRERGQAQAEALKALFAEIKDNGDEGFKIFMAEKLPSLFQIAADSVEGIDIDRLIVMDGGDGNGVGNAAFQRIGGAWKVMEGLAGFVGISPDELAGRLVGNGNKTIK